MLFWTDCQNVEMFPSGSLHSNRICKSRVDKCKTGTETHLESPDTGLQTQWTSVSAPSRTHSCLCAVHSSWNCSCGHTERLGVVGWLRILKWNGCIFSFFRRIFSIILRSNSKYWKAVVVCGYVAFLGFTFLWWRELIITFNIIFISQNPA